MLNYVFAPNKRGSLEQICMSVPCSVAEYREACALVLADWITNGEPPHADIRDRASHMQSLARNAIRRQKFPTPPANNATTTNTRPSDGDRPAAHNPDMQTLFGTDNLAAYRSYTPALATLSRVFGRETAEAWLEIQLKNLADYSGARDKLNEFQRLQLARVIIGEWGFLHLSELMRFFFRFKAGRYGRFYGSVDPLVITEALCLYQRERLGEIAEIEQEERRAQDEAARAPRPHPRPPRRLLPKPIQRRKTMIQEQYVTMETAKLLRSAGFPQENGGVTKYYLPDGTLFSYQYADYSQDIAAPTHAQAMRWLREEKRIFLNIVHPHAEQCWSWWVPTSDDCAAKGGEILGSSGTTSHPTYESAAEAGIQAACKWLIEKGGDK